MRNIPTITKNLLIINVIAYLAMEVLKMMTVQSGTPIDLNDIFGLHFFMASDFHVYQIVTYMFMHGGMIHLFFNMFALWMFGCVVENVLGAEEFPFLLHIMRNRSRLIPRSGTVRTICCRGLCRIRRRDTFHRQYNNARFP